MKLTGNMIKKKEGIYFRFSISFIVYLCTFLNFCFTISWRPTIKRSDDGDEPMNQPVDKMVNQYFRWRCELLDNRPIQGEFSKDGWKWWKMWDGYYDLYGEMIQLPRWMCYDQQLTVVKQKCKEFVKVTIQWNWLVICSTQIQGIYFLFDVLSFLAHSCIFVSPFAEDQPQNEMNTVMDQRTSLLIKWWSNTSDGDVSYLTTDQLKVNSVKTVGNGERCEMYTTTCMVKWSNYQDECVMWPTVVKQKCKEFVKVTF